MTPASLALHLLHSMNREARAARNERQRAHDLPIQPHVQAKSCKCAILIHRQWTLLDPAQLCLDGPSQA